jgi:hypothetical protein
MNIKRILTAAFLILVAVSFVQAQSLTEAARKEKERRAALKGKTAVVVTNADLAKVRKTTISGSLKPAEAPAESADGSAQTAGTPQIGRGSVASSLPADGAGVVAGLAGAAGEGEKGPEALKAEYQDKYDKAKERIELLNLKMMALQQQFNSFNTMTPKNVVQQQMAETFAKLETAKAEEVKAKADLDRILGQIR